MTAEHPVAKYREQFRLDENSAACPGWLFRTLYSSP